MVLPTNLKTLLDLIQRNRLEILSMKATSERDKFELLVRVRS